MSQVKQIVAKVLSQPTRASKRAIKLKQEKVIDSKIERVSKAKVVKKHTNKKTYLDMVKSALTELPQSTRGISRRAILKFVISKFNLTDHNQKSVKYYVNSSLVSASKKGEIARVKGASDSFKLVAKKKTDSKSPKTKQASKNIKAKKTGLKSAKPYNKKASVKKTTKRKSIVVKKTPASKTASN